MLKKQKIQTKLSKEVNTFKKHKNLKKSDKIEERLLNNDKINKNKTLEKIGPDNKKKKKKKSLVQKM